MKKVYLILLFVGNCATASQSLIQALELADILYKRAPKQSNPILGQLLQQGKKVEYGFIRVPVLDQGFKAGWPTGKVDNSDLLWDQVKADDGANCGYHALKNVLFLMNALEQKNMKFVQDLQSKMAYIACMSVWTPIIYDYRGYQGSVNWLLGSEIDLLVKNLSQLSQKILLSDLKTDLNIVVTEDVSKRGAAAGLPVNETMLQPIKDLAQKRDGLLGVVWSAGTGGHWVGFVIYKEQGISTMYYMNSCSGDSDFKQAYELFSMSADQIDRLIQHNQTQNMLQDINKMSEDLDILDGITADGRTLYAGYVGCVERTGSMFDNFTTSELQAAGFVQDVEGYKRLINQKWQQYLQHEVDTKINFQAKEAYKQNASKSKKRVYGFWINPDDKTCFCINLGVDDCKKAGQKYKSKLLVIDQDMQPSFFDPVENINILFTKIIVAWKDYQEAAFNNDIKKRVLSLLERVLRYLQSHKILFKKVDWKNFGEHPHTRKFAGFEQVIDVVLQRIRSLPGFNEQQFKQKWVESLLNL